MPRPLLIANRWIQATETISVSNPFDGSRVDDVFLGGAREIDEAIASAHATFEQVKRESADVRAGRLTAIAAGIERRRDELAKTIMLEAGKPITLAEAEVTRALMTFRTAAEETRSWSAGELLPLESMAPGKGHLGITRRFPLGVIAGITPFNFPLNLVAHKVAPCIATGNTMVLKPALKTPLSALLLAEILVEAGIPSGQVNVVLCPNESVGALVADPRVKKISFTGSETVGWMLKANSGSKRVTLELGGNAAVIVHEDADLDAAVPAIATGAFAAAGQSCISVQRIFVHRAVYETFRERLIAYTREKVATGDPAIPQTLVGPMINHQALLKAKQRIDAAVSGGATVLLGGGIVHGTCLEPTILENVDPAAEIYAEEVFAPICLLQAYDDFEDALAKVNDSRFGLQAGVYTRDIDRALRAFDALEVGGVLINQVPTWRVENMPYGGVKQSGFGREGIRYAMEEMTELRSLIIRRT